MSNILDLTALATGNAILKAEDIPSSGIITGDPREKNKRVYIPAPYGDVAGMTLIVRNRSNLFPLFLYSGTTNPISDIQPGKHVQVACDGYEWFIV